MSYVLCRGGYVKLWQLDSASLQFCCKYELQVLSWVLDKIFLMVCSLCANIVKFTWYWKYIDAGCMNWIVWAMYNLGSYQGSNWLCIFFYKLGLYQGSNWHCILFCNLEGSNWHCVLFCKLSLYQGRNWHCVLFCKLGSYQGISWYCIFFCKFSSYQGSNWHCVLFFNLGSYKGCNWYCILFWSRKQVCHIIRRLLVLYLGNNTCGKWSVYSVSTIWIL